MERSRATTCSRTLSLSLAVAAGVIGLAIPASAAKERPNLAVSSVSASVASIGPGGTIQAADATKNRGPGRAGPSITQYYLSADAAKDGGDLLLGERRVKALEEGRTSKGKTTLTVLSQIFPGPYFLVACADGLRKLRERNERNNCRSSPQALTVIPAALPGPTQPTPPTPGPTPAGICGNGVDDDADTAVDFPADSGCSSLADNSERGAAVCDDNLDNDADEVVDFPADPGCSSTTDDSERGAGGAPQCDDGDDNDLDANTDYPADAGCGDASDTNEQGFPACSDGVDNDGDGTIDFGGMVSNDPGCGMTSDTSEHTPGLPCDDALDNDGDTRFDFKVNGSGDFQCMSPVDFSESA